MKCECGFKVRSEISAHKNGVHHKQGMIIIKDSNGNLHRNEGHSTGRK